MRPSSGTTSSSSERTNNWEDVGKILGSEYITMWFNEATDIDYAVVSKLQGRVVQQCYINPKLAGKREWFPKQANPQVIFDANPKGKRHWLYKVGVLHVDPVEGGPVKDAHKWVRVGGWKPNDNSDNINSDMLDGMSGVEERRGILGEWCDAEGLVYGEFKENKHICRECQGGVLCPKVWDAQGNVRAKFLCRSMDFGFNDPTVCLWGAKMGGQLLIYRCYYKKDTIMSEHAVNVLAEQNKNEPVLWTVVDHDPDHAEVLRRAGIPNRNAYKDNPRTAGVNRVRKRLTVDADGYTGFKVCQFCSPVIEEFQSYLMDKKKDEPENDKNDHTMDAIRYMVAEIDCDRGSVAVFM